MEQDSVAEKKLEDFSFHFFFIIIFCLCTFANWISGLKEERNFVNREVKEHGEEPIKI